MKKKAKKIRLFHEVGLADIIGTYRYWKNGKPDPRRLEETYSGQFFDLCKELNAVAYIIAFGEKDDFLKDGDFKIRHYKIGWEYKSGIRFHVWRFLYNLRLAISAILFKADVVVTVASDHLIPLILLSIFGIKLVPDLHSALKPKYMELVKGSRVVQIFDKFVFSKFSFAIMSISSDVSRQIKMLTANQHAPISMFLPLYRKADFKEMPAPKLDNGVFNILFAGRIEEDKGVFELIKIAQALPVEIIGSIKFDICGEGSALNRLKKMITELNISDSLICHGNCNAKDLLNFYAQSNCVIVPTTISFMEGFNQVIAEAILAARPVITSRVCPALEYVKDAAVEVPPDDVEQYAKAIVKLKTDRGFYIQKQKACYKYQGMFYDSENSWGTVLKNILYPLR